MHTDRKLERTLGGQQLRLLRQRLRFTLAEVEVRTTDHISPAHLHRIEAGRIRRPDRETLEVILAALQASYRDRCDVLAAFGYQAPRPLPTDPEIAAARRLCQHELQDVTWPVCLIDDGQRLLGWSRFAPRLLGLPADAPALAAFRQITVLDLAFEPDYLVAGRIANAAEYLPMMLHFVKAGLHRYHGEAWYQDLLARSRQLPGFSVLWDRVPDVPLEELATHRLIPLSLAVPDGGVLHFQVVKAAFVLDPRFQLLHLIPYGARTMHACARWAAAERVG